MALLSDPEFWIRLLGIGVLNLLLSGDNTAPRGRDQISLSTNGDFIGAVYAPNASFRMPSNFNLYGSIMCKNLDLASYSEVHFDEGLRYGYGSTHEYAPALWRRMPHE